jgi:UDP-N-acetylglucosamine--N-acetylmuramyl-(pentapeptide) pyrophosphoryl-undecaprenol N-acetylglucosamine transferase
MFVSSNGTGLGHLTRSMAIARRLDPVVEPLFVTLSRAAPVVRDMGFPVEYMASHGSPGAGSDWRWSRRIGTRLRAAIGEAEP